MKTNKSAYVARITSLPFGNSIDMKIIYVIAAVLMLQVATAAEGLYLGSPPEYLGYGLQPGLLKMPGYGIEPIKLPKLHHEELKLPSYGLEPLKLPKLQKLPEYEMEPLKLPKLSKLPKLPILSDLMKHDGMKVDMVLHWIDDTPKPQEEHSSGYYTIPVQMTCQPKVVLGYYQGLEDNIYN